MSFGNHQDYAQQWHPELSMAPAVDDQSYHPPESNYFPPPPPPPPMYMPNPGNYYPHNVAPNHPSAHPTYPPHPPMPFSDAMQGRQPSYGAHPVPPPGFLRFPPVVAQPSNGTFGASAHQPTMDMATERENPQTSDESLPQAVETDDREEGELSSDEREDGLPGDHNQNNLKRTGPSKFREYDDNFESARAETIDSFHPEDNVSYKGHDVPGSHVRSEMYNPDPAAESLEILPQRPEIGELLGDTSAESSNANGNNAEVADITMNESSSSSSMGAEPSGQQLRTLAQGALLNLAPHNIRFSELVEEGINPLVLKKLYEEIGIKVADISAGGNKKTPSQPSLTAPVGRKAVFAEDVSDLIASSVERERQGEMPGENSVNPPEDIAVSSAIERQQSSSSFEPSANGTAEATTGKPLERKDLIARMLAAKNASKPAQSEPVAEQPSSQSKGQAEQGDQVVVSGEVSTNNVHSSNLSSATGDVRTKEINRAQTELARQRMEQLKKQGLRRSQTHATEPATTSQSTSTDLEMGASEQSTALRHPLPDRPPEPEPEPEPDKDATTRIPGLFMAGPEPADATGPSATDTPSIDRPASTSRVARKRPRASDFTEDLPELPSKKSTPQGKRVQNSTDHKVVIDISDDESIYGSDDDHAATSQKPFPDPDLNNRPASALPIRGQTHVPSMASPLPQKPRNHEYLQAEIDNLRQAIAERERRLNEKAVASQPQAVTASGEDEPSDVADENSKAPQFTAYAEQDQLYAPERPSKSPITPVESFENDPGVAVQSPVIGSDARRSDSSFSKAGMDSSKREELRKKFMRKKEIESGLPLLEAELTKSEAKLAQFKEEEKRLLAEIAKGKAGRLKLVQELEGLGVETDGLTMEELQSTKESLLESDVNMANDPTVDTEFAVRRDFGDNETEYQDEEQSANSAVDLSSASDSGPKPVDDAPVSRLSADAGNPQRTADVSIDEPDLENATDDKDSQSSSAMDESMGSEEDDVDPSSGDESPMDLEDHPMESGAPAIEPESMEVGSASQDGGVQFPGGGDDEESVKPDGGEASQEPSVASDVYEPPEPSIGSNSPYSPPFSPAPPESAQHTETEQHPSLSQQDVEQLTTSDQHEMDMPEEAVKDDDQGESHKHFTPYESPLSRFRAYRYHPQYTDNVQDDKILVEMGSLREGKTAKEQEDYVAGLRQIINDMRRDKVKDFTTVATEIAAYRRRFLEDPSRVLAL